MITLVATENIDEYFESFINAFFINVSIRITGYGLSNDWTVLGNTHMAFKGIETR